MSKLYNLNAEVVPGKTLDYILTNDIQPITGSLIAGEDVEQFNLVYQKGGKIYLCVRYMPETAMPIALTLQAAKQGEDCNVLYYGSVYCKDLDLSVGMPLWASKNPGLIDVGTAPDDIQINIGACLSNHEFFFYSRHFHACGDVVEFELVYPIRHLWSGAVIPSEVYQHYKKLGTDEGCYIIIATGKNTETEEIDIVYMGMDGRVWIRPEKVFLSEPLDGVPRFTLIEDYDKEINGNT